MCKKGKFSASQIHKAFSVVQGTYKKLPNFEEFHKYLVIYAYVKGHEWYWLYMQ